MAQATGHGASTGRLELPPCAFGTMEGPGCTAEAMYEAVLGALKAGVRALDTAEGYASLEHVGRALRDSGVPRGDVCVVSKLTGLPVGEYAAVRERAVAVAGRLGVESIDVLLVHFPAARELDLGGEAEDTAAPWPFFAGGVAEAWRNMLQLRADGVCRHVGVSNFYAQHLAELRRHFAAAEDQPALNQLYVDAAHHEEEFVRAMQQSGVQVMAYRPLAFAGVLPMVEGLGAEVEAAVREEGHESLQSGVLAWLAARGVCSVWRSSCPEHVQANAKAAAGGGRGVDLERWAKFDGNEMVDMFGGADEFAALFKRMAPPADQ